jgi:DNA-binding transcriptional LysR family regulator
MDSKFIAFTKAAKLGSFKEAAEELGYTQAGVSYMISSLEKEMGVTLFHRGRTGAQLTEEGRTLLPWVLDIVNDESALEVKLREMRNLEIGDVRIASFASVAIHWLPDVFVRFMEDHPHIKLDVTCFEEQDEMEDAVQNGEFDCCFLIEPSLRDFYTIPLSLDPLFIVVPEDHPLAHKEFFPAEALAQEPYIKVRNDSHTEMDALFERHGVVPNVRFEMDNDYAVMGMVSRGLGYGVFPELMLRDNPFKLVRLKPEIPTRRTIALAVKSYPKSSFATRAFIESARSVVGELNLAEDMVQP